VAASVLFFRTLPETATGCQKSGLILMRRRSSMAAEWQPAFALPVSSLLCDGLGWELQLLVKVREWCHGMLLSAVD
jgi:hypothetical protein